MTQISDSTVSCLAALGSLLSGLLVFLHYYPDLGETYLCNGTFLGNCNRVNESSYSTLFGFPIAAYGLFFYLVIWWTMLVADYAQGSYGPVGFALLFPLIVLALLVDLVLVLLLIKLRQFCSLLPYLCDQPVATRRFPFLAEMAAQAK